MATRLHEWREKRGMTQAELAAKSGVSLRSLQNYEQGKNPLNKAAAEQVYRIARALRCAVEDLLETTPDGP